MRTFLLVGLVFALAPGSAAPAAPPAADVIAKDGVEVTILPTVAPAGGPEAVEVALDVEARTDEAARRLGFRSLRGVTAVDCRQGANQFQRAEAYALADLQGEVKVLRVSGEWVHPTAGSYMAAVSERICGSGGALPPPGPAMVVTLAASANTLPPADSPAPATAPAPAPPAAPPAPPAGRTAAVSAHVDPPAVAAGAPAPAPAGSPRPGAQAVAQVTASPTAKGAQRVLDALHSLIAPPLAGTVESATVQGVQVYRASIAGFASPKDARAFCSRAAGVAKTCWVRLRTSAAS
ncbi:MAG: SPOR domain-containing protein [Caulobacterales bacterium]